MAAWIVHGCEGSGSVETLSQCCFDPDFRWMLMVNTAAGKVPLGWLVGAVVRTLLFQSLWKVLPSKASWDSIEQLLWDTRGVSHIGTCHWIPSIQGLADPVWLIGAEEPQPRHLAPTQNHGLSSSTSFISHVNQSSLFPTLPSPFPALPRCLRAQQAHA